MNITFKPWVFCWLLIIVTPSISMIFLKQTSFTFGVFTTNIILTAAMLMTSKKTLIQPRHFTTLIILTLLIVTHTTAVQFNSPIAIEPSKFAAGLATLVSQIMLSIILLDSIRKVDEKKFLYSYTVILHILIINGVITASGIDLFNTDAAKPSFIFQEPSHYAIAFAPFIISASAYFGKTRTNFVPLLIAGTATLAIYIQNVTLLITAILAISVHPKITKTKIIILTAFTTFIVYITSIEFAAYFLDRIIISNNSENLSVLVLLQGWENAIATILNEKAIPIGSGFQQFGINTLTGNSAEKIFSIAGTQLNNFDGGSLAPKLIGEFGVFGIIVVAAHIYFASKSYFKLKRQSLLQVNKQLIFAHSVVFASIIEMYVRGTGYFSPTTTMLWCSIFFLTHCQVKKFSSRQLEHSH